MPHIQEVLENNSVQFIRGAQSQEFLEHAADFNQNRLNGYTEVQGYYDGIQGTELTDRLKKFLENNTDRQFNDNFVETVIDTVVNRLRVSGFTSNNESLTKWIEDTLWQVNRMDDLQRTVHHETSLKGDGMCIASWDEVRQYPRITFNRADMMNPSYSPDDPEVLEWVSKKWNSNSHGAMGIFNPKGNPIERMNIYYDDRVEKYFRASDNGVWSIWLDEGDQAWPVPLIGKDNQPLGIPVFHFRNKPRTNLFGRSEVASVLPMQDFINKSMVDLALLLDNYGMPQRWATGITEATSSSGDDMKIVAGEIWTSPSENAKFGQFDAEDARGLLDSIEMIMMHIAGKTQTPLHILIFSGDTPSGEALKSAESGLIHKIKDRQTSYGNVWENLVWYCAKLQNNFSNADVGELMTPLQTDWEDPESRNEVDWLESKLLKKQLGVSEKTLLSEMGYDPEKEEEQTRVEREARAALMAKTFEQDI